jgi:hypothetical protein
MSKEIERDDIGVSTLELAQRLLPPDVASQLPEDVSAEMVRAASKFYELAAALPSTGHDASADILLRIFDSASWDAIGDPWDTTPKAEMFDRTHELMSATLHPSDYAGAMPVYAYVEAVDIATGEQLGYSNGGIFCLAQLAYLAAVGKLEGIMVRLVRANKATRQGFFPYHYVPVGHTDRTPTEPAPE